ncbi:MAG: DNA-binding protein, partial [Proteobacteria bacterium]
MEGGFQTTVLTVEETARFLNLKISKVRSMVFRREIPYLKIGRLVRFQRHDLEAWLASTG